MCPVSEPERLRRVYAAYNANPSVLRQFSSRNLGNQVIVAERMKAIRESLATSGLLPLSDSRILEIGCGVGGSLARMMSLGARPSNLYGIDLLPERIASAQHNNPGLRFSCMDAANTAFRCEMFDIILIFAVFSSIFADEVCRAIGAEIARLLRPGGAVVWYDLRYRSPWNKNVRPIRCSDIRRYFPAFQINLRSLTLLPPIARRLPYAYRVLNALPVLRSHWFGLLIKS